MQFVNETKTVEEEFLNISTTYVVAIFSSFGKTTSNPFEENDEAIASKNNKKIYTPIKDIPILYFDKTHCENEIRDIIFKAIRRNAQKSPLIIPLIATI